MVKSKFKKLIAISFMTILIILSTRVNAQISNTFKAKITPIQSTIKPGEEIIVTISVSDIDMGENGINALEGMLEYDKEIFEEVKSSSIESYNNWATTYNDEKSNLNGKFLSVNLSAGVKEDTKILSIKFKAKNDIKQTGETIIKIKDVTSNNGKDLINVGDLNVKVTIQVPEEQKNETSKNETIKKEPTNNTRKNTTIVDNTFADKILPKAGINNIIAIIVIGILLIGTGAWIYKTRKKIK